MKREIKFRAWQKNYKRMLKVSAIGFDDNGATFVRVDNGKSALPRSSVYYRGMKDWPLDALEIMQYTGLKDRDGKEIYEGDIVQFSEFDYNGLDTTHIGVVAWSGASFSIWGSMDSEYFGPDGAFDLGWARAQDDEFEIMGNVYDNPELLTE